MNPQLQINPTHEAADAFWKYWKENGETHHHGYYESTWGAINAALQAAGWIGVYVDEPSEGRSQAVRALQLPPTALE